MRNRFTAAAAAMVTGALALTACSSAGSGDAATGGRKELSIVGFAVPEAANKALYG